MPRNLLAKMIPRRLREVLEQRVFYAVFNTTRVTNDAYGWRPDPIDPERNTAENRSTEFFAAKQQVNEPQSPEDCTGQTDPLSKH